MSPLLFKNDAAHGTEVADPKSTSGGIMLRTGEGATVIE